MSDDRPDDAKYWFARSPFLRSGDSPPPSPPVEVVFGAQSRHGSLGPINDDHYLIARLGRNQEVLMTSLPEVDAPRRFDECAHAMVVADGTGSAGEVASRLAISTLMNLAIYFGRWNLRIDEPIAEEVMDRVGRFYRGIDAALVRASRGRASHLQSALTGVYIAGTEMFIAHVGDSRAYVFRDGELMQLTRENRVDLHLVVRNRTTDGAIKVQDLRPLLTQTLGGPAPGMPTIEVVRCGVVDGDIVLVCTNGLTDVVSDERIANALQSRPTPDEQCGALVDLAVEAGGEDDVTVLAAHYRIR